MAIGESPSRIAEEAPRIDLRTDFRALARRDITVPIGIDNISAISRCGALPSCLPLCRSSHPAPHRVKACRGGSIQSHAVPLAPATTATPGRADPEPESPSFHRGKIQLHAAADLSTER